MAISTTTKMANRLGLNLEFYTYTANGTIAANTDPVATIDFANEVSLELSTDLTWATGGRAHSKMVGFRNPYEGTLKISTQIVNMAILHLVAEGNISASGTTATFKNDASSMIPKYYIIKGKTLWQDEEGNTYDETITVYKACVKPNYNVTYNGEGDPQSLDVEFELGTNDDGEVVEITRADNT